MAELTAEQVEKLMAMADDVAHMRATFDRAMPVIDAYLSPTASGPGAWAVRRQLRKGADSAG